MKHAQNPTVKALAVIALFGVGVCGSVLAEPAVYSVRSGDNLTVIARHFGTSVGALKRDNDLRSDRIRVGQILTLRQPFRTTKADDLHWRRPIAGGVHVLRPFGDYRRDAVKMPRRGVDVVHPVGGRVYCPAPAVLRFLGEMEELGTLAILEHGAGYHTVFAPLDPNTVVWRVGAALRAGDEVGRTAPPPEPGAEPYLHVELRRDEQAIDPKRLLEAP